MMAEYIDREKEKKTAYKFCVHEKHGGFCERKRTFCNPSCQYGEIKELAPVVHGRWKLRHGSWYCPNCGKGYKIKCGVVAACKHNYCPNCGAKMDGAE